MRKYPLLAAAVFFAAALSAADVASAIETNNPTSPNPPSGGTGGTGGTTTKHKTTKKPKPQKSSSAADFLNGWHKAYALVYDKNDYVGGIAALRALGYDDNPDVATLIGYASRKLGRYDDAKYWYDKALAADPNHVVTWSYYGMWQAEQGNLLKAKDDLEKVRILCGNTDCPAYTKLKAVIDGTVTY
jgi:tetratricopeptide (TPR) repeat protein